MNVPDTARACVVPRCMVGRANAPAPTPRGGSDLPRSAHLFRAPAEPSRGRFCSRLAGWDCEMIDMRKLHARGLLDSFGSFRPGTGGAPAAAIDGHTAAA
ncbi:MAG: ABC transporter substrate-binding protein, partial [Acetobacteraceae bacterium]